MRKSFLAILALSFCTIQITQAQNLESIDGKALFGDISARQIGPALMSGRINAVSYTHLTLPTKA